MVTTDSTTPASGQKPWSKHDLVLITGGHGMLGRAVRSELADAGFEHVLAPGRAALELLDREAVTRYFAHHRPAHVLHLASRVFGILGNMRNQALAIGENTLLNHNVLTACAEHGVRKVFLAGSVAAYPFPFRSLPLTEDALWEGAPHHGEFGYASAKRHAIAYLEVLRSELGIDFFCGLLTNLYGPHDTFDAVNGHVIPSLVLKLHRVLHEGGPLEVWGDGRARRDFLYVQDAARAILLGMGRVSGVANICSGATASMRDVVDRLVDAAGFEGDVVWQPDRPVGIEERSVSDRVLRGHGFTPEWDLAAGIRATWEWFAANRDARPSS